MSILIVDDSELSAKIMEVNLRKKRLETTYAPRWGKSPGGP